VKETPIDIDDPEYKWEFREDYYYTQPGTCFKAALEYGKGLEKAFGISFDEI
jgi:hypothetical protein